MRIQLRFWIKTIRKQFVINKLITGKPITDDPELEKQLEKLNLALRSITGDGNCLFRAISDQITGSEKSHLRFRREAVKACSKINSTVYTLTDWSYFEHRKYVKENKDYFAPFIEEFDDFVENLNTSGEFAGNEAIVALARVYKLKIIIHQANQAVWNVDGSEGSSSNRQLHIGLRSKLSVSFFRKFSWFLHFRM